MYFLAFAYQLFKNCDLERKYLNAEREAKKKLF